MRKITLLTLATILFFAVACKSKKAAVETTTTETTTETTEVVTTKVITRTGGGSLEDRLARQEEMYTKIGLNDAQKDKFRALETSYSHKTRAIKDKVGGNKERMMSALKALQANKESEIKAFISADQFAKYKKEMEIMRAERRAPNK